MNQPEAISFANNYIRPVAELARAFRARVADMNIHWQTGGISAMFPNTAEVLDDGRVAEGVSRLTGADVQAFMSIALAMAAEGNDQIIEKPTVRPLQVT